MIISEKAVQGKLYINGQWKDSLNKQTIQVVNPGNKELVGYTQFSGREDAREAIAAASDAFPRWKNKTAKERGIILEEIAELMMNEIEEIAHILTLEQGKPLKEAKGEITQAADFVKWYAEEGRRIYGDVIPSSAVSKRILTWYEPVGVTAAITPWNFPVSMITRKLAPALAAGCTVVLKPSEETPLSAIKIFEIFERSGLPKGVANLVIGEAAEIGDEFLTNSNVKKLSFTGSTVIGKQLYRRAADQVKRVSLELGGHAPFIVFEDADLELAIDGIIQSKFRNAGQTCVCANRIYIHENIVDRFTKLLVERVKGMKIGSGLEKETQIGPVINQKAIDKIQNQVDDALKKNAELILGGKQAKEEGFFYEPTILSGVTDEMVISYEETFGPVLGIWSFKTDEEVIKRANNSNYGLAAYYYTNNLKRSYQIAEKLEYGILGLNDPNPAVAQAPFGGLKESGIGREGGSHGIKEFLEVKYLSIQL